MAACSLRRYLDYARAASLSSFFYPPTILKAAGRPGSRFLRGPSSTTSAPGSSISSSPSSNGNSEALTKWQQWLQAPYPHEIVEITNKALRDEIFRKDITSLTSSAAEVSLPYHHSRLERRGDSLAYLIADQVASLYFDQVSDDVKVLSSRVNRAAGFLVSNRHWTLLTRQFGLGPVDTSYTESGIQPRLADNFEAYIYGLLLDRGFDAVASFLTPIFLKYLAHLAPPPKCLVPFEDIMVTKRQATQLNFKESIDPSTLSGARPPPKRLQQEKSGLPYWLVACSDGAACKRSGCYFAHPNEDGEWAQWQETTIQSTIVGSDNNEVDSQKAPSTALAALEGPDTALRALPSHISPPPITQTEDAADSVANDTAFDELDSDEHDIKQLVKRVQSLEAAMGPMATYINAQMELSRIAEEKARAKVMERIEAAKKKAEKQRAKAARDKVSRAKAAEARKAKAAQTAETRAAQKAAKEKNKEKEKAEAEAKAQAKLEKQQEDEKRTASKDEAREKVGQTAQDDRQEKQDDNVNEKDQVEI